MAPFACHAFHARQTGFYQEAFTTGGRAFGFGTRAKTASLKHWPDRLTDWLSDGGLLSSR